jgi:hypothetical protein
MSNLDGMMNRIAALIAKAESSEFPEEAKTFRAKAEELLRKYRIEESELISTGEAAITPRSKKIDVSRAGAEFLSEHYWIWNAVAKHCGVRFHAVWVRTGEKHGYAATAVGYDVDLRWAEMLFASALLVFGQSLEPEYNPAETAEENIYRLRSAGIDRQSIAEKVFGRKGAHQGASVGRIYKEECARRGETAAVSGRTVNAKTYRAIYARRFVDAFERRLREARDAANSDAGALVLVGRSAKVDETFYKLFPQYAPKPKTNEPAVTATSSKPSKGLTKAERERINREHYGPAARAAATAANAAAGKVRLDRSTTHTDRLEERAGYDNKEIES